MERYKNSRRDSGIKYYQIEDTSIKVKFDSSKTYSYSNRKAGAFHVSNMKKLAIQGRGLNRYVKKLYD